MFEKPNIDRNALFCDETEDYRCPSEANAGDTVTFRFRTGRGNVDRVLLVEEGTGQVTPLRRESFNKRFDFYSLRLRMEMCIRDSRRRWPMRFWSLQKALRAAWRTT